MKLSFANHINVIAHTLQPSLMGASCMDSLKELCSLFPFNLSRGFGFESRLGDQTPSCDFSVLIGKGSVGAKILSGKNNVTDLNESLLSDPQWQRIRTFFINWNEEGHFLNSSVGSVWLEFDYNGVSYNRFPNFFFGITVDNAGGRTAQSRAILRILDEIYRILACSPFPDKMAENLERSVHSLPEHARLNQIGLMLPRHKEDIRLVLVQVNAGLLESYLRNLGWPGDFKKARILLDRYSNRFDYFVCNLNTGVEIHPYLALEMLFNNLGQPQFNMGWKTAFELLEADRLVTAEKREALLKFCGKTQCGFPYPATYIRGLNHLKIVYKETSPLECKGYFGTLIQEEQQKTPAP